MDGAPNSRLVLFRGTGPIPKNVLNAIESENIVIDPSMYLYGYNIPPVNLLQATLMYPQTTIEIDYHLNGFLRVLRYATGQPFVSLAPGSADLKRRASEDVGVAVSTCWCIDTLGLKSETLIQIPAGSGKKAKRADFIGECNEGDLIYEAKGTTQWTRLGSKLDNAATQKESSSRNYNPHISLAFAVWIPTFGEPVPPLARLKDPPFDRLDLLSVMDDELRRMFLFERLARYARLANAMSSIREQLNEAIAYRLGRGPRRGFPVGLSESLSADWDLSRTIERFDLEIAGIEVPLQENHSAFLGVARHVLEGLATGESPLPLEERSPVASPDRDEVHALYSDGSYIAIRGPLIASASHLIEES